MTTRLVVYLTIGASAAAAAAAFTPDINRQALAGLWRLSKRVPIPSPLKEFTVYPKKPKSMTTPPAMTEEKYLLMLKEDGSFKQYSEETESEKLFSRLQQLSRKHTTEDDDDPSTALPLARGTWHYDDGQLMLASERPDATAAKVVINDTLIVGRVVAHSQETMPDGEAKGVQLLDGDSIVSGEASPTAPLSSSTTTASSASASKKEKDVSSRTTSSSSATDTHLAVPKGTVKSGKFFYPRNHPSFFDQPMFKPKKLPMEVELHQVLGQLNTQQQQDGNDPNDLVELFRKRDLENKTYLLTSHSIEYKPKGRWSQKLKRMVIDKEKEKFLPQKHFIRALEVKLWSNNTFCTTKGLGEDTILRGKWSIVGDKRDNLWMQIWRFGFGRSVSGSTYSEGKSLSHEDAKTYWGKISYQDEEEDEESNDGAGKRQPPMKFVVESHNKEGDDDENKRLLVIKGSVMMGWGIEPVPVARFVMREVQEETEEDEEEYDDDFDSDADEKRLEMLFKLSSHEEDGLRSTTKDRGSSNTLGVDSGNDNDFDDELDWDNAFQ